MRVFTNLPQSDWRGTPDAARFAEDAGFDALMTVELGHDVFAPLILAAMATERIELTTSIAVAFPRSPTVLASQAWDLQANSNGRFVLGLGSQVKGHNERRFGVPWSPPVPRLREYIEALRAIWRCWEKGETLNYVGEHYKLTMMSPGFSPDATGLPMVPITVSAVGPAMLRLAGHVCDGVRLHPLCTRRYLEEACLPQILEGMRRGGRQREHFDLHGGGFVCTGPDDDAVRKSMDWARQRIAFYASTRTYLAMHGMEDVGLRLHEMTRQGRWGEMAGQITDEALNIFAACGRYDQIPGEIERRFGGVADAIEIFLSPDQEVGPVREMLADVRRIAQAFEGFSAEW